MKGGELETVFAAVERAGVVPRGAFRLENGERDGELAGLRTIVLAGMAGREGWPRVAQSPEAADGLDHPLDRWSRRVIETVARELGAKAFFPFGGPPFWPFHMGAPRRTRPPLADRPSDPSALRLMAFLPRRAWA